MWNGYMLYYMSDLLSLQTRVQPKIANRSVWTHPPAPSVCVEKGIHWMMTELPAKVHHVGLPIAPVQALVILIRCFQCWSYVYTHYCVSFPVKSLFYDKGLVINNATMLFMLDTRFINGAGGRVPYLTITSSIITTFAVNAFSRMIYFADAKTNSLHELDTSTRRYRILASTAPATGSNWVTTLLPEWRKSQILQKPYRGEYF